MTETSENSNLEGESELSYGFFYLDRAGNQTTSEGNLVSEGICPPDFGPFSKSSTGFKFGTYASPQFHGP